MKTKLIYLLLFQYITAFGQTNSADSLERAMLKMENDTNKVKALNEVAFLFYQKNPTKTIQYAKESLKLANKLNFKTYSYQSYNALAAAYWVKGDYTLAIDFLLKKIKILEKNNNLQELSLSYLNIGALYIETTDILLAKEFIDKGLAINLKINNLYGIAKAYHLLGNFYNKLNNEQLALEYWQKSKKYFTEIESELDLAYVESNLALLKKEQHQYTEALNLFLKTLKTLSQNKDYLNVSKTLDNIGDVYVGQKNYEIAENYYLMALDTIQKYQLKKPEMDIYLELSKLDSLQNNFEKAYFHFKKYSHLKDEIFSKEKSDKIIELQLSYEQLQTEKENQLLKENQKSNQTIIFSLGTILLVLLSALFFINQIRKQLKFSNSLLKESNEEIRKQKEKITTQNSELNSYKNHLEERIALRTKELIVAKQKAEESDQLKTAFLNNISHEIRTPLNVINGFTELIIRTIDKDGRFKKFQTIIYKNSQKLLNIIEDVIELSRLQLEQLQIHYEVFDLVEFSEELYNYYLNDVEAKNLKFIFINGIEKDKKIIKSDKKKIHKIVQHLIENAIKFTKTGNITLNIKTVESQVVFKVTDTGIGIPEPMQSQIFKPFRQIEVGSKRNYGGNGIGLSLVKGFTHLLKGSVELHSEYGKGSSFVITIPFISEGYTLNQPMQNFINNSTLKTRSVLIVEDEISNYFLLEELLREECQKIYHASNGEEAIEFCKKDQNIEIVLMDIKMPILNGIDATKQIKELYPEIIIIAQTAYGLQEDKEMILTKGFDDYITKPIDKEKLLKTINKSLFLKENKTV